MVEPAFLALTTTPSMAHSLADWTCPARAAGACALAVPAKQNAAAAAERTDKRVRIGASMSGRLASCNNFSVESRPAIMRRARQSFPLPRKRGRVGEGAKFTALSCLQGPLPSPSPASGGGKKSFLVQRFHLHDRALVVVADPERHRRGGIVHVDAADVGLARQEILHELAGLGIEPRNAVIEHRSSPHLAGLVDRHVIRRRKGGRHFPFLELLGLGVEHIDLVAAIEAEPDADRKSV